MIWAVGSNVSLKNAHFLLDVCSAIYEIIGEGVVAAFHRWSSLAGDLVCLNFLQ